MSEITARAVREMTAFYSKTSRVRVHDINHFLKVWGFARTIGLSEGLDPKTQKILELAAIAHDIACPLCREKYGNTAGKYQEEEGGPLTEDFYRDYPLAEEERDRIVYLVSHHHTYTGVDGMDYQILLEADFLVNADESSMTEEAIRTFRERVFRTRAGLSLLEDLYL